MLATNAEADLRHQILSPIAGQVDAEHVPDEDELAPARGVLLGSALGAVCFGLLAAAGWWLF